MEYKTYFVRGILRGQKQPEEHFTSEVHARKRAAYLGTVYDSVVVDWNEGPLRYGRRGRRSDAAMPRSGDDSLVPRWLGLSIARPCAGLWSALSQRLRYRGPDDG